MTVARGWRRLAILAIACVAVACTSGPPPPNDAPYVGQIEQDRAEKDAFFKTTDGPLTPEQRRTFTSLPSDAQSATRFSRCHWFLKYGSFGLWK